MVEACGMEAAGAKGGDEAGGDLGSEVGGTSIWEKLMGIFVAGFEVPKRLQHFIFGGCRDIMADFDGEPISQPDLPST